MHAHGQGLVLHFDHSENSGGTLLDKGWKFLAGDDSVRALNLSGDSGWIDLKTSSLPTMVTPPSDFSGVGWFHLHFYVDSSFFDQPVALTMVVLGSAEIYIDGKLTQAFGKPGKDLEHEAEFVSKEAETFPIVLSRTGDHQICIRYSAWHAMKSGKFKLGAFMLTGFNCKISKWDDVRRSETSTSMMLGTVLGFVAGFFAALALLHTFLFFFFRKNKSNLYYSIFSLCMFWLTFSIDKQLYNISAGDHDAAGNSIFAVPLLFLSLAAFLYSLFYEKFPKLFWFMIGFSILGIILEITKSEIAEFVSIPLRILIGIECLRVVIRAIAKKFDGAWIIGSGVIIAIVFPILAIVIGLLFLRSGTNVNLSNVGKFAVVLQFMLGASVVSISVSMSIFLARQFAKTNRGLEEQIIQVRKLSEKTIEQEKEKKKILESQNEQLEIQVKERTAEVVKQKEEIEEKSEKLAEAYKDMRDSIHYAKRIQEAILPSDEMIRNAFPDAFVFYQPKDIVSGDFYWLYNNTTSENGKIFIAAADCTGHGVPGAFMSTIGCENLNEAVQISGDAGTILQLTNRGMKKMLHQSGEDATRDGMDIALLGVTFLNHGSQSAELNYAGANRPLWIIRKNSKTLEEIKATKVAIGGLTENDQQFQQHDFQLEKGDTVYLFSDGFADQFSPTDKKLMTKRFKEILVSIQEKPMNEQKDYLKKFIEEWRGGVEQVDDILVIGIRI